MPSPDQIGAIIGSAIAIVTGALAVLHKKKRRQNLSILDDEPQPRPHPMRRQSDIAGERTTEFWQMELQKNVRDGLKEAMEPLLSELHELGNWFRADAELNQRRFHDLNNVLNTINLNIVVLQERRAEPRAVEPRISEVRSRTERR